MRCKTREYTKKNRIERQMPRKTWLIEIYYTSGCYGPAGNTFSARPSVAFHIKNLPFVVIYFKNFELLKFIVGKRA